MSTIKPLKQCQNYIEIMINTSLTHHIGFLLDQFVTLYCSTNCLHFPNICYQVDEERHRISLGMKNSYMGDEPAHEIHQGSDEPVADGMKSVTLMNSSLLGTSDIEIEGENDQLPILSQAEERASIPPLDVALDDFDQFDVNNTDGQSEVHANEEDTIDEKKKRREKKRAREERSI